MIDKAPYARFTPTSQSLVKVNELTDGGERVVVSALHRCSLAKHVGQKSRMSRFLIGHKFNQCSILSREPCSHEIVHGECCKPVVEQVQFDPFLIQTQRNGFEIEIALNHVAGQGAIGTQTTYIYISTNIPS